ncbi:PREDICTED: uncharacterized protein LOC105561041 [Vollenhovia emeryi]|uniref:uncharacterized protein LOC105561041 n=1 Tax=Vollenhovia emeryi TaxID=411798 RepID=UPI0005F4429F|nr:PREDICTED: uncharacterized protein LOC105561041 [Vollenhovia emeryi]
MKMLVGNVNDSINTMSTEAYDSTSDVSFTVKEEDAIVTLVVVVIGIIIVILALFSMGIFIDCKHQKKDSSKKRRLRLKMPPLTRKGCKTDVKALAPNMYPNGADDTGLKDERDDIV